MKLKLSFAGILLLLSSFTFPVQAQPVSEPSEQVTVFAPYAVRKGMGGSVRSPIMMITISRKVSYHDLDLRSEADIATLKGRVTRAARDLCRELDRRYSPAIYVPLFSTKRCQGEAAQNGLWVVDALVALARN